MVDMVVSGGTVADRTGLVADEFLFKEAGFLYYEEGAALTFVVIFDGTLEDESKD
mgnify:CR=1 FL=1